MVRLISVVGARPQFIKLAPVASALQRTHADITHDIVHTGQHYDDRLSSRFFEELGIPKPVIDLEVGSATHGVQTASMLAGLEAELVERQPQVVLVYGDTNSTLAAALAASKLQIPVVHIEAGLRSHNRTMPEEINRRLVDHCSDRLYAPTPAAIQNLVDENLASRSVLSGDVMRDAVCRYRDTATGHASILTRLDLRPKAFGVLTVHRASNTTPAALATLFDSVEHVMGERLPLVFPVHPRTQQVLDGLDRRSSTIRLLPPVGYRDMLTLMSSAAVILTDSGGVQKEAAFVETPCITLREETEWTETVDLGVNHLVGNDRDRLHRALSEVTRRPDPFDDSVREQLAIRYGDGHAADVIIADLLEWLT